MSNVTIVLPVSRDYYLSQVFTNLELLECDRENTNILVYVDGDHQLYQKARNLTVNSKFAQKLCVFRAKGQPSVGSVRRRRERIAKIHNELKENIQDAEYLLLIEDDTLFPTNSLDKMLEQYAMTPYAGIVSGAEIGRWGYPMIGGWKADDVYEPNRIVSVKEWEGVSTVDATGLYCCLTRTELYMQHEFKSFEDILGPDVEYGLSLRRAGFVNYLDQSIKCTHLTPKEQLKFSNTEIVQVELVRDKENKFGWRQGRV